MEKSELRKIMKTRRDAMDPEKVRAASQQILESIRTNPPEELVNARTVLAYVSINNEVQTTGIIQDLLAAKKTVLLPKMFTREHMSACEIASLSDLVPGRFGIPVPSTNVRHEGTIDACIIPGVAFSEEGDRLGHGLGHYDRFLSARTAFIIALAYAWQVLPTIPVEAHDKPVNLIVTEKYQRRFRNQ